jgi:hypothetical protein
MKRIAALMMLLASVLTSAPAASAMKVGEWTGRVEHVSTDNLKVYSFEHHRSLSFLLLPRFRQIFSRDGKTTYQMEHLRRGMIVKVYYDQRALGARHADRILVLGGNDIPAVNMKS